ncbi:MAG TPA: tyrosine-type recombinase/integrase [Vicinamibacterales bacterium]|nr:tyrosine-type recombinase/integrase [Vicinamibacterales bacterium]
MASVTLTARYLDQLKSHGKRYEVFDAIVPGLAIRVSASGRKTFTLYYRHRRRMRRVGLGRYPDVLLEKARKIATQHRGRIFDGADPAGEKQTEHTQDENTVQALYELYRSRKEKVLRSWSEVRRILEKEVLPTWRHRRVADIRRRDIRELVEEKAQTAPIQGNRVLERISALFTFAVDQDWIEANPAWRIKKPGHERSRDRVLTRDELRELWPALHETEAKNADGTPKPRLSQALNDVFLVMLLTAQRCGEVCQMQWREVDLDTGWWLIPGNVSKNHGPHRVPLTSMVLDILGRRARVENADDRYVFSNYRHTCVADRAKKAAAILCKGGVSFHFRAHDLRRTAASYMGEAGVDRFHIAHVLNHRSVTHSTVTAIYDRYRYDKEKRVALEKWAEVLSGIVEVKPAPTTAPAKRTQRQNVYDFKPRALRRAGDQAREVGCEPTQSA